MSNTSTQNRHGSSYTITYPDFPSFDVTPQNIKIFQEIGMQDVVELTYPRFSSFYVKALKTGVPLKIMWKNDKTKSEWAGYVYDVKKNTNPSLGQPIIVRAISSSLAMKDSGSKIWIYKTLPDIVSEVSKKFKLKPVVTPHKAIFSQQSMAGHTYWEKIQELASTIGYVAHISGTELHFHPLDKMIDKFMTVIPTLSFINPGNPPYSQVLDQTLDVFRATLSDYSDIDQFTKKKKNIFGVDPLSGKMYTVTSSPDTVGKNVATNVREPLFSELVSDAISGSKEMAQIIADAKAQFSRFVYHATGAGQGDPRIAPFRTIEISGTGEDTDGFWVVKKVQHFLTFDGRYEVEFSVMRDGSGANKTSATRPSSAGPVPYRDIYQELSTGTASTPTLTILESQKTLVNQTQSGFKTTPRRWIGR